MNILYHDLRRRCEAEEAEINATFYGDLNAMLALSDCVVLATPSARDGSKLITASALAHFKPGARFVNIARGSLVDEDALVSALEAGHLAAAMLDVHEHEPQVNSRLAQMMNVTLTCHNAGGTLDTHIGFERLSMENIDAVLKEREPLTPVNLHMLRKE
jgi:lactate dehydrogenase-like 2-hydroxyacid dehydrogenase